MDRLNKCNDSSRAHTCITFNEGIQLLAIIAVSYTHLDVYKRQAVLHALNNLDNDFLLVAKDDELGRKLQDLDLPARKRAPKKGNHHGTE